MNARFFFLLLIIPLASAQLNISNIGEMKAQLDVNWTIGVDGGNVSTLNFTVYAPVNDSNQQLLSISSSHPYTLVRDGKNTKLIFSFDNPGSETHISTSFLVRTDYRNGSIPRTVSLPLNAELENETNLTAFNDGIKSKAYEVIGDKDDALEVLAALEAWVHNNIMYDLAYADKELSAIDVFNIRRGTCDEFSHLLISFGRVAGIPMSFVSGYVNSGEKWDFHAWVEAEIPGIGPIEIDPTYNELFLLDATHIRVATEADQSMIVEKVSALGDGDAKITTNKSYDITILEIDNFEKLADLNITTKEINESHEAVDVEIKNMKNEYIFVPLKIYPTLGLDVDTEEHMVYLPPLGNKTVEYVLTIPPLKENAIYTFPIDIETLGEKDEVNFTRTTTVNAFNDNEEQQQIMGMPNLSQVNSGVGAFNETGGQQKQPAVCAPAFILLCALLFSSRR